MNVTRRHARWGRAALSLATLAVLGLAAAPTAHAQQTLYAAISNNTIEEFTPGGGASIFASGTTLEGPEDLAFDGAGNLYAANSTGSTIERFTPGGVGTVFASTGLNAPHSLAFDSAGNLYVANAANSTIEKFTPGGVGSVFASNVGSGLYRPMSLAFGPAIAPEPSQFVALGLGVLGLSVLALRARRRGVTGG